ncbi:MAG: polysaccharide deacetylase family protein, partial [Methyloprofundus sp.]|nr:polysaccharide deacetylase family protein [Methyloprofundus sp.]
LLGEFLGLAFDAETYDGDVIEITRPLCPNGYGSSDNSAKLTLDASFFHQAHQAWLKPESMPVLPLASWNPAEESINANLVEPSVPVLYGQPHPEGYKGLVNNGEHLHLNLDIFGSAFFMLSRYEELITKDRDNHDRFPATASVAYKAGFLDRPIVNEYLEILWQCLHSLWPDLQRKERKAGNFITCDTDWPFDPATYRFISAMKKAARLLIKDKKPIASLQAGWAYLAAKLGLKVKDSYREAISWMMNVNEEAGNRVAFYFITHNTSKLDTAEDFDSPRVRALFREITNRGHEIGLHPGYETYNNPANFTQTANELKRVLQEENITQDAIGGRQHFLRWDTAQTPRLWEQNGLAYDSTLSFADKTGFRCGVCYEFTMYDLLNRKPFKLKQRPLIVMECTLIAPRYEGLGYTEQAMQRFSYFKKISHQFNGTFNLLWHNSHFENKQDKAFYKELIQ